MENVVLVIHLILALCLIGIVLMQRSEGGGLGIGGGGGGATGSRAPASAMTKVTWGLAVAFICTSIAFAKKTHMILRQRLRWRPESGYS